MKRSSDLSTRRGGRGQALVETALVLPVFILILVALFDFGRAIYTYNTVANAARSGVRTAVINQIQTSPDCDETRPTVNAANPHSSISACAVRSGASIGVVASDVSVSYAPPAGVTYTCSPVKVGCIATVTVQHSWSPITPIISTIVNNLDFSSSSSMPVERVFP